MTSAIQNSAFRVHHSRRTPLTPHYTIPYNAKAKIIEPWHHHWVHERFDKKFTDGYCGSTPQDRPESLAEVVKRGGLMKWSEIGAMATAPRSPTPASTSSPAKPPSN